MSQIVPTSKMSLKMSCLSACSNDVHKAEELYDYLIRDIASLPDTDPIRPSGIQQIKESADEILGWIGSHQEDFMKGISLVQTFRQKPNNIIPNVEPIPPMK